MSTSGQDAGASGAAARHMPPHQPAIAAPTEFDLKRPDTWEVWLGRLESFLRCYGITDEAAKRDYLLSCCGMDLFGLAVSLVHPRKVDQMPFTELTTAVSNHLAPKPTKWSRRYEFFKRNRAASETATSFLAELRSLARWCEFTDLEEAIIDQFICGQTDKKLVRKLCSKRDLNLESALAIATAAEESSREARKAAYTGAGVHHESPEEDSDSSREEVQQTRRRSGPSEANRERRTQGREPGRSQCGSCGDDHPRRTCRFRDAECRRCGKPGHIARACRAKADRDGSKDRRSRRPTSHIARDGSLDRRNSRQTSHVAREASGSERDWRQVRSLNTETPDSIKVTVTIEGSPCHMCVDTGSPVSIISAETLKRLCPRKRVPLKPPPFGLRDFQRNPIALKGVGRVRVQFGGFHKTLDVFITEGPYTSLLGMSWMGPLGLRVVGVNSTRLEGQDFAEVCEDFPAVFDGSLGLYNGPPVSLQLDPTVRPIRVRARRVPFALKPKIDAELDRLIGQGILEPVPHGEWETPIVTPVKPDGSVRICADYKCTLNKALPAHAYPVPVVQHVLATLAGAKVFGKLDLAQAYQQLPVDGPTAAAQTIVTHRGAFRVKRLQFGVCVAPGLFQNLMDNVLKGIPGVTPFFDDVLIAAPSREVFATRLRAVLQRFNSAGLKVKREKCKLGVDSVEFLGYMVDAEGIHPAKEKLRAISGAPAPTCKAELQAFLGLLNFYHVFLPHKAAVAEPLHRLLDKGAKWVWGPRQKKAFQEAKDLLVSNDVLAHFDESLPVVLACDASPYGVGAVLGHKLPDGREVPVAYFSQTLSKAERNYAQIDKEGLAIVKGVKKFHDFLYGRPFTILTDHKPLLGLFAPDRQTPQVLSPRVLRWSIFLASYQYSLEYRKGKAMGHADGLSRLPLPETGADPAPAYGVMAVEELPEAPLHAKDIARYSAKDKVLSRVLDWVGRGWPHAKISPEFDAYWNKQDELSVHKGCLLWGNRVVVPPPLRQRVIRELHETHPGVVRMKALARSYVWWPKIDDQIETWVKGCGPCQESRPSPPRAPGQTWEDTRRPWSRLHIDFAGPFQGRTFLIAVDSHSKWVEIAPVPAPSSAATIRALRGWFATHGLPDVIVSDNGTAFTSQEFQVFTRDNGIHHIRAAPFHPATNGQAERMVRSAKEGLKRLEKGDVYCRLAQWLLAQHNTPCTATGFTPAELLMGRKLTTLLDRIHPDRAPPTRPATEDRGAPRGFFPGDPVYAENHGTGPPWVPARVVKVKGPTTYEVSTSQGQTWKRHIDQLRPRLIRAEEHEPGAANSQGPDSGEEDPDPRRESPEAAEQPLRDGSPGEGRPESEGEGPQGNNEVPAAAEAPTPSTPAPETTHAPSPSRESGESSPPVPMPRRSGRERQRPRYLDDYVSQARGEECSVCGAAVYLRSFAYQ